MFRSRNFHMIWKIFTCILFTTVVTKRGEIKAEVTFIRAEIKRNNVTISASDDAKIPSAPLINGTSNNTIMQSDVMKINRTTLALNSTQFDALNATSRLQTSQPVKISAIASAMPQTDQSVHGTKLATDAFELEKKLQIDLARGSLSLTTDAANGQQKVNQSAIEHDKKIAKGGRRSEVYVVNNGLLLLHPKRLESVSGVKKSTQPLPPSVNYHVIKKQKINSSVSDIASKVLDSHVSRRSLLKNETVHSSLRRNLFISSRGTTSNSRKNNPPEIDIMSRRNGHKKIKKIADQHLISKSVRPFMRPLMPRITVRKAMIENPLFDIDQSQNDTPKDGSSPHNKERKRSQNKESKIPAIEKIPDIENVLERPEDISQYPRFKIQNFKASLFPRFPLLSLPRLENAEYPRFPIPPMATENFPRYPIRPAALINYPRYPKARPALELPRSQGKLEQFKEYPHFEYIKPLDLEEFPRFDKYPEPTSIPDIKDIAEPDRRSRPKRTIRSYKDDASVDDNDDINNNDDDDDDEHYYNERTYRLIYPIIEHVDSIPRIQRAPKIPSIPDIPFIQDIPSIPSLHPIHGIHPIQDLQPLRSISRNEQSQSSAASSATVNTNSVNIKS